MRAVTMYLGFFATHGKPTGIYSQLERPQSKGRIWGIHCNPFFRQTPGHTNFTLKVAFPSQSCFYSQPLH